MTAKLNGRKIVLIGGAGFIGHNLALSLAQQGAAVEILDSLQVNNLLWFASNNNEVRNRDLYLRIINQRLDMLHAAGIPMHVQDARDYHALSHMLDRIKPDI